MGFLDAVVERKPSSFDAPYLMLSIRRITHHSFARSTLANVLSNSTFLQTLSTDARTDENPLHSI